MKRILIILTVAAFTCSCDSGYLESEYKEELVVEAWIENGHAPVVFVSSTLPVSSEPQSLEKIKEHILRYADVSVDCEGKRYYLTARLTDKYVVQNYFTSSELRGEVGKTYALNVKWLDYEAKAVCTIPPPTPIDTSWFEPGPEYDFEYVAKIRFSNVPEEQKYYQTFQRIGSDEDNVFRTVNFTTLDGTLLGETVTETFMKPLSYDIDTEVENYYFRQGDSTSIKLATMEKPIYDFWASYANAYNGTSVLTAPANLKGNVEGAIGYWAGYGISVCKIKAGR